MRCLLKFAVCLLILTPLLCAQHQHDPLSDAEIDQLRDTALDPVGRLKLYVEFARARLAAIDKARNDPKAADRAQQTHDKLQEFLDIYDEMDDNIENFDKRGDDLRNPLKAIVQADNEFQVKLRALHDAAIASPAEASPYQFLLSDAFDDVDAAAKDHRDLLLAEEEAAKHKKKTQSPALPPEPR
jgi:hypothetical protein